MAEASAPDAFRTYLKDLKLSDVLPAKGKDVITLDKDATVEQALATLRDHNILSVPLIDKKKDNEIVGILNLTDLSTAIAFQSCFEKFKGEPQQLADIRKPEFEKLLKTDLFSSPASSLLGVSAEGKHVWEYPEDTPLDKILEIFSKGVHRTIVLTKAGKRRILSQSDVVAFLKDHASKLGDILEKPIDKLGLIHESKSDLIKMTMYESALVGFQRLYNQGWEIPALPIVDKTGDIVASLSASDLRGLTNESFGLLLLPVLDFLREVTGGARPVIIARTSSVLGEVVRKVVYGRVHRVWVVENYKIVGVVSLSDIICKFSPYDFKKPVE